MTIRGPILLLIILGVTVARAPSDENRVTEANPPDEFSAHIRPILKQYCLGCHSAEKHKGSLNLERFASSADIHKDLKPWITMCELLEAGEMPPESKPQPTSAERDRMLAWVHGFLNTEALARAGDPGDVPLRRLSNAEYDDTIRDLTGVDLRPTREFPADGAGGEGFTNSAEALSEMSPTLLGKYFNAAKDISTHAVLLPDGFRFSSGATRADQTNEIMASLREFYARYTTPNGELPVRPYLLATVRYRDALAAGMITLDAVAAKENLNRKYLAILYQTLADREASFPLDQIRSRWRHATEKDLGLLVADITGWQTNLWKIVKVGSYRAGPKRQIDNNPAAFQSQTIRLAVKPTPGQSDVVIFLSARHVSSPGGAGYVLWGRPRLEGDRKKTLLLRDYNGLDASQLLHSARLLKAYGIEAQKFGRHPLGKTVDEASLVAPADSVIPIRLPASLFHGRQFVVEATLDPSDPGCIVQCQATTQRPADAPSWDGQSPILALPDSAAFKHLLEGFDDFRRCFPAYICYPHIIPVDEVVCLKRYHREDGPLADLFLDDEQRHRLDRLWDEHRFISQWPVDENNYLPIFIGFVTQDQTRESLEFYEAFREPFRKRAEEFENDVEAAVPKQMGKLIDFASRAYRRPLRESEQQELRDLQRSFRSKGMNADESFRAVLARVLVSPAFLFKLESAPPGKKAAPVNDWELATRLSYFLWSSMPDDELRTLAASGKLHDPQILADQARRMLKDDRTRALAIEFGTQWIHVHGFDEFKEKSERLFPTFDAKLRADMYEESILFFQGMFQQDRPVTDLLDADYTFLNDRLARHYAIPGVNGPQWRKVDGVKKFGRGGILTLASVHSRQAGAARTSPVLRGNWVVETLLGEKLPRPPPDVPKLPEEEGIDGLTTRQRIEKHTSDPSCRVCHQRIDPIGFALERYDAIGRLRTKESSGLPIDCAGTLKDGTELTGIDGLRQYLLTRKKDVIVRLFCRRLLGYALGRAAALSDQSTLDEMVAELNRNDGRLSAAVLTIVRSPQFRMIRGSEYVEE